VATDYRISKATEIESSVEAGAGQVILSNGRLVACGSLPDGVSLRPLSQVIANRDERLGELWSKAPESLKGFAALNALRFEEGWVLVVEEGCQVESPITFEHRVEAAEATVSYPRALLVLEEGASCTVIERFSGSPEAQHLSDEVIQVYVAEKASLRHTRMYFGSGQRAHCSHLEVQVAGGGDYKLGSYMLGGSLTRSDIVVRLVGERATVELDGLFLAADEELVDHHVRVEHHASRAQSNQTFRGVVTGRGHAVFDGIIEVKRDAQQTDAHMQNRNLLLSDRATLHTKPHLEIDADDVACSHGATVGALDDDQLFYLRARGIPEADAKAILTYAFVEELVARAPAEHVRDALRDAVLGWLPEGHLVRGILA
jgi:Fe-S cluster assembly protein SufD